MLVIPFFITLPVLALALWCANIYFMREEKKIDDNFKKSLEEKND